MRKVVDDSGKEKKLALLRAHPDLAGKLAIATFSTEKKEEDTTKTSSSSSEKETLTTHSTKEQKGAGLDQCTETEFNRFHELNKV